MGFPSIPLPSGIKLPKFKLSKPKLPKLKLPKLKRSRPAEPETASVDSPVRASPTTENPNPAPYELSERLKALFADTPRKGPSRTIPTIYPRQRASRFTKFHRGVRKAVGTYMIRLGPKPPYDRPYLRKRTRIARKVNKVRASLKRRAYKVSDGVADRVEKLGLKIKDIDIPDLWRRHVKRERNAQHGMDYDVFVDFMDTALGDLYVAQLREEERREQEEAAHRESERSVVDNQQYGIPNYHESSGHENTGEGQLQPENHHGAQTAHHSFLFDWELGEDMYRVV